MSRLPKPTSGTSFLKPPTKLRPLGPLPENTITFTDIKPRAHEAPPTINKYPAIPANRLRRRSKSVTDLSIAKNPGINKYGLLTENRINKRQSKSHTDLSKIDRQPFTSSKLTTEKKALLQNKAFTTNRAVPLKSVATTTKTTGLASKRPAANKSDEGAPKAKAAKKIPDWDYKGRFLQLNEKYEQLQIHMKDSQNKANQFETIKEEYEKIQKEHEIAIENIDSLRRQNESQSRKCQELKANLDELKPAHETLTREYNILQQNFDKLNEDYNKYREQCKNLLEKLKKEEKENEELNEVITLQKIDLFNYQTERRVLHNIIQDLKGNIRVFCRVRPPLSSELDKVQCIIEFIDENGIEICKSRESIDQITGKSKDLKSEFTYDKVFTPESSQEEMFEDLAQLVQSALDGYNVCVFAYGQTGSGKTYIMQGGTGAQKGMIPRTFELIFKNIAALQRCGWSYTVKSKNLAWPHRCPAMSKWALERKMEGVPSAAPACQECQAVKERLDKIEQRLGNVEKRLAEAIAPDEKIQKMNTSAEFLQIPRVVKSTGLITSTVRKDKKNDFLQQNPDNSLNNLDISNIRESTDVLHLPEGQNTSYTSCFSDNEAIEVAATHHEYKENCPSDETSTPKPQSPAPSRSTSPLTCLPNGKLPLESTVTEMVWGCVKPNKCFMKKFMIRNRSDKTLGIQCSVSTQEYKIRKDNSDHSDHLSTLKLVLCGQESMCLVISFVPTKMGPALDALRFAPLDSNLIQTRTQCVHFWGYGGYMNIEFLNTSRDSTGKYWLSLGKMDNRVLVEQFFIVKNTGNLTSFTYIKIIPKNFVTFLNVKIEPNIVVLLPNQEKNVTVTYTPNAKDCQFLKQNRNVFVIDIGKLEIVSGPEVNRARLRRLCRKSLEKGLKVDTLLKTLSEKVPADSITSDVLKFKESPTAIPDLLETFANDEIVMTIEQDPNQTLVAEYPEDSIIYQTLCKTQDETVLQVLQKSCRIEPAALVLCPPSKSEDLFFLISDSQNTLHFKVNSNPKGLHVTPTDGALAPGGTAELKIKLLMDATETAFKILVHVENEVFEAEVSVAQRR